MAVMERYQKKIGCFLHIPNVGRGLLKYVGPVKNKPGTYAGIDLLANIGKNDGSFQGVRYFESEYPQSGLFIQLQKVAALIDNASNGDSRRSTLPVDFTIDTRVSSGGSSGSVRRTLVENCSPTPARRSRTESTRAHSTDSATDLDLAILSNRNRELLQRVEKQDEEIAKYKKLLDDQRVVLEELQPTIDGYEESLKDLEAEISRLRAQLAFETEQQKRQKQYFESEHEQLLAVVDELHEEIKANERRVANEARSKIEPTHGPLRKELEEAHKRIAVLERQLDQAAVASTSPTTYKDDTASTVESLPIYRAKHKIDAAAGRESWCALCERSGHESIDCPYELPLNDKGKNISADELLF